MYNELGWECIPLAVETYMYGCWGTEARQHLGRFAFLSDHKVSKPQAIAQSVYIQKTQLDPGQG